MFVPFSLMRRDNGLVSKWSDIALYIFMNLSTYLNDWFLRPKPVLARSLKNGGIRIPIIF